MSLTGRSTSKPNLLMSDLTTLSRRWNSFRLWLSIDFPTCQAPSTLFRLMIMLSKELDTLKNYNSIPSSKPHKKCRSKTAIWFKPPFNKAVSTNLGAKITYLVDIYQPPGSALSKFFNRNTIISYSFDHFWFISSNRFVFWCT